MIGLKSYRRCNRLATVNELHTENSIITFRIFHKCNTQGYPLNVLLSGTYRIGHNILVRIGHVESNGKTGRVKAIPRRRFIGQSMTWRPPAARYPRSPSRYWANARCPGPGQELWPCRTAEWTPPSLCRSELRYSTGTISGKLERIAFVYGYNGPSDHLADAEIW